MARSLLFNVLFYVTTALVRRARQPAAVRAAALGHGGARHPWRASSSGCSRSSSAPSSKCAVERSCPRAPASSPAKHQSAWETFALIPLFRDPALLMKRELFWIPFHGWFSKKFEMIPVDRDKGPAALRRMLREAKGANRRRARDHHLPGRHAAGARSAARLQDRGDSPLRGARRPLRAGRAQFGAVLAPAEPHPPARHHRRRIPRSHPAGAAKGRVSQAVDRGHRDRLEPPFGRSKGQGTGHWAAR